MTYCPRENLQRFQCGVPRLSRCETIRPPAANTGSPVDINNLGLTHAPGISWPALNQAVCALRFFYGVTLGLETIPERIAYAREPRKLPIVLNADEVVRFLEAVPSLRA